jgi:hypothetical protein
LGEVAESQGVSAERFARLWMVSAGPLGVVVESQHVAVRLALTAHVPPVRTLPIADYR